MVCNLTHFRCQLTACDNGVGGGSLQLLLKQAVAVVDEGCFQC